MTEAEQAASMPFDMGNPPTRILLAAHEVYRSKCVCPPREGALCYHCTWLENFHKELKALQATTRQAARREVYSEAIALVALIGMERDPNGDKHTVITTIQEFRRRTQQETVG